MTMTASRVSPTRPSVARLLVDLPRARLAALARIWSLSDAGGHGLIAALYRQMSDARVRQQILADLPPDVQLVFTTLVAARRPLTLTEILRLLPFSEASVESSLNALETSGLAWRDLPLARDPTRANRRWFVAREIDTVAASSVPPARGQESRPETPTAPELRAIAGQPTSIRPAGAVLVGISRLDDLTAHRAPLPPGLTADALAYAKHCGIVLGVWRQRGSRGLEAGPRESAWRALEATDRIRALTRLWLVDERSPRQVPGAMRRALLDVVRAADASTWYDLNSIARRVAWLAAAVRPGAGAAEPEAVSSGPGRTIARRDLESAADVMGWIGIISIGDDVRGRPVAIQRGEHASAALE